ncbi:MAG: hypothetical protein BGO98_44970 [Myxococcales bacterium 68-20]|nr:MAG: hypothetical protein BGO98_44970 [Myxococcales bacterium 68-20]
MNGLPKGIGAHAAVAGSLGRREVAAIRERNHRPRRLLFVLLLEQKNPERRCEVGLKAPREPREPC